MERSRTKGKSPRTKIQYAPEGRRGNMYVDEEGRRIYKTSGKSGHSKRYVVMDDGELKRGERQEPSKIIYQEEAEYETVSEADSEHLVPVRPKGERRSTRRVVEGKPRVVMRTVSRGEGDRYVARRTVSEERPRVVTKKIVEEVPREAYISRSRNESDYVVRRDLNDTRDSYFVRSSRPASEIVMAERPRVVTRTVSEERPRVVTKRIVEEEVPRGAYITRSRPASAYMVRRELDDSYNTTRDSYLVKSSRPASDIVVSRPSERDVYVRRKRPSSEKRVVEDTERMVIRRPRSEERLLHREEYIDYPREYLVHRPSVRDVGCQMTTNYVIQQPPKQRKLLRNVQTQTLKREKHKKIKTATHYFQRETVEVVHEPEPSTPRLPTPPPPPRTPTPPRIPTPEPPKQPKPKKKRKEKNMQLVVKQPNYPEPVYDTVEDLEVVPASSKIYYEERKKEPVVPSSSKIYYEEPRKEPLYKNSDQQKYAYYEPSEYTTKKYMAEKTKGKAHMVRVGGGWMKVEHHRNHHTPLKIYEIPRDANDDKFLYIKSRFNTSKKDVPVAYKKYREEIVRG